jgi:Ribbon-helix-helix protein, copG family
VDENVHFCSEGQLAGAVTSSYLYLIAHRIQITLSDEQYSFLKAEADRSSVSIAELIRRAIDTAYGILGLKKVHLITHTLGRRPGIPIDDDDLAY